MLVRGSARIGLDDVTSDELRVDVTVGDPAVASLQGELDIGARETIDRELVVRPGSALELDLSGIGFADIEGTRILVTQLARLSARGVSVTCRTRSPSIARLLSLVESVIAAPRH